MIWQRKCDECGHKQFTKPVPEYKNDSWRDLKCKKCGSIALDYGSEYQSEADRKAWEKMEEEYTGD